MPLPPFFFFFGLLVVHVGAIGLQVALEHSALALARKEQARAPLSRALISTAMVAYRYRSIWLAVNRRQMSVYTCNRSALKTLKALRHRRRVGRLGWPRALPWALLFRVA
ncbi:hypothetical protein [Candidatus Amarobacter glycogenicus]|uniref:hypothetical protein n=1 Tax=Candidatus Amarobacter glycogenicus TaxID=3140699 RepID=UPI0031CCD8E4